ncbi:unnamed protein product [Cylindrotheca closterium]|uniref:Uncharacterized protein n=1 Tax=Cylindrotheca closterium TaxID=2856 RepID=A0AAD2G5M3_9STRA|nr:unnamed protein product [Cylindrotheca closterium]
MDNEQSAIQLNDSGLHRLLDHKFAEAAGFFRDAVCVTKAILIHQQDGSSCLRTRLDLQLDFLGLECYQKTSTHEKFRNINGTDDNMLCKTALSICRKDANSAAEGLWTRSFHDATIAASVTYNLAIATHLWALHEGSIEKLRLALYYYEIAYGLQIQEETTESSIHSVLSILNNVANIYLVLGDHGISKLFLEELMAILPHVRHSYHSMSGVKNQGICWENILRLMMGPPSAANAA